MVSLALLIVAFILFLMSALNFPAGPRINLVSAGLAFWVLSIIISSGVTLR